MKHPASLKLHDTAENEMLKLQFFNRCFGVSYISPTFTISGIFNQKMTHETADVPLYCYTVGLPMLNTLLLMVLRSFISVESIVTV